MKFRLLVLGLVMVQAGHAYAADGGFTQFIGFGASNTDTGWFANASTGIPSIDTAIATSITLGGHASFNGPGLGNADMLAAEFGLTARPANTPGGTNYAIGGAFTHFGPGSPYQNLFPNLALPGIVNQVGNYLGAHGGQADPNALYYISGTNSITAAISAYGNTPATQTYLNGQSAALTGALANLQAAGARHIIVGNIYYRISPDAVYRTYAQSYFSTVWNDLHAAGVKFIPSDLDSVILSVTQNMSAYGFTAPLATVACTPPALQAGYGAWCAPTTTPNGVTGYLVSPNAQQTHLSLDFVHTTTVGQQIQSDYNHNLLVAPGQVSLIAESAIKSRTGLIRSMEAQVGQSSKGNVALWADGNWTSQEFHAARGFATASGEGQGAAAGVNVRVSEMFFVGAATGWSRQKPKFNFGGGFDVEEVSGSVRAEFAVKGLSVGAVATYGTVDVDLDRRFGVGITTQQNTADVQGTNTSLALLGKYEFDGGALRHGPYAGLTLQRAVIDAFTEQGSYTSLTYAEQVRESAVTRFGYRASLNLGVLVPFAEAEWSHEFADDRDVEAALTTVAAPSYTMQATTPEPDWAVVTLGAQIVVDDRLRGQVSLATRADGETSPDYFAMFGLNYTIPPG